FHLMLLSSLLPLNQYADIDLIRQNSGDSFCAPYCLRIYLKGSRKTKPETALILHRRENPLLVQYICNPVLAESVYFHSENILYDLTGVCIYNKTIFILRIFQVSIAGKCSDKFTVLPFHIQMTPDLYRQIPAVRVVDEVLKWHDNIMRCVCIQTVIIVIHCNESDTQYGKEFFQISSNLDII